MNTMGVKMEYTAEAYLRRLPTEKLETFLQDYMDGKLNEDFSNIIGQVTQELARRKVTNSSECSITVQKNRL